MPTASSSSGFVPNVPRKFDVFISFRGEETRNNFTSHLHSALNQASLEVFRDDTKLKKGHGIAPSINQAIKDSSVSVIVFSKNYASSKWCLDELHQIMQYRKKEGQYVIPIFYKVDPSHVRNQTGAYKKAFGKHEIDYQHEPDRVNIWRTALSEAANLSGWDCKISTDESKLIQEIVTDVRTKLEWTYNCRGTLKDAIGIDEMIEPIEKLLEKSHKVGIWGMGGVGKTTMAKAVFAKFSYRYDNCCFLEKVREKTKRNGLEHVRNSLISTLLGQDMQNNPSLINAFVARRLGYQKALVVLDDVYSSEQLEDLLDNACNFLRKGSKVIITTRDKKLLKGEGYEIHEAKGLSCDNSRQLFIRKAFRSDRPKGGFEQLIKGFVDYSQNNPLAIKVLGSYVHSEDKDFWDDSLRKLPETPRKKIHEVLRLSFDGLDYDQQQIFLDIGCFLKGESETFVKELLESYGFHPITGLQTLKDKALIVTTNGKVEMHDLIQKMAYQIVREESQNKPGKRSRLWDPSEIHDVLNNCEGEEEVEGMMVNIHRIRPLHMTAETFNKTPKIRFLKFYSIWDSFFSNMRIKTSLESISTKMSYFHWEGYPGRSLPSNFCAKFLLEVNLEHSHVETLWEGEKDLANLRRLKLGNCTNLSKLPDFSKACKLESVDLSGCCSLSCVPKSVLSHDSLISLSVRYCSNLESLKSSCHLKSLKELDILGCVKMKEFCVSSEELTSLDLSKTLIDELSPSIGRCLKLTTLNLFHTKLKHLPIQVLSSLTSLKKLKISDLQKIDSADLSVLFDSLRSLRSVSLVKCCGLTELPDNITLLSSLEELSLTDCRDLQCLPKLPPSLELLDVNGCTAPLFDSSSIDHLSNLNRLCFNTSSLGECPLTKLCDFKLVVGLRIHSFRQRMDEANLEAVFDALQFLEMLCLEEWPHLTRLPSNVGHLSKLNYLSVKGCTELLSLPELPPSLRSLIATNCTSLKTMPPSTISRTPQNKGKKFFSFINCKNLEVRAIEEQARWLLENAVHEKEDVAVYYRGKKVPKWFGNNRSQNDLDGVNLSLSFDNLMGFVFCNVILDSVPNENCLAPSIIFGVKDDQTATLGQCFPMPEEDSRGSVLLGSNPLEVRPGSVLLCSNPTLSGKVLEKIEGYRRNHEAATYNQTLFFKFTGEQKYGVHPIYASECSESNFNSKKIKAMMI